MYETHPQDSPSPTIARNQQLPPQPIPSDVQLLGKAGCCFLKVLIDLELLNVFLNFPLLSLSGSHYAMSFLKFRYLI